MATETSAIPKNETVYATLFPDGKNEYLITARPDRLTYFLYKKTEKGYSRVGKDESPAHLEKKYIKYSEGTDEKPPVTDEITITEFELVEHERLRRGDAPSQSEPPKPEEKPK